MSDARLTIRPMGPDDVGIRIDYFWDASDEHLRLIGVDRARLPDRAAWLETARADAARPARARDSYGLIWELEGEPVGFSTSDRITVGHDAFMHLHVTRAEKRHQGLGARFVRLSVAHYVEVFELETLRCEPNALNVAPNRTLQQAGFRYECSREATPTPINFPQIVTRWVLHRDKLSEVPHRTIAGREVDAAHRLQVST